MVSALKVQSQEVFRLGDDIILLCTNGIRDAKSCHLDDSLNLKQRFLHIKQQGLEINKNQRCRTVFTVFHYIDSSDPNHEVIIIDGSKTHYYLKI